MTAIQMINLNKIEVLNEIVSEQKMTVSFMDIPPESGDGEHRVLVSVSATSNPSAIYIGHGFGDEPLSAGESAASEVLECFRLILR